MNLKQLKKVDEGTSGAPAMHVAAVLAPAGSARVSQPPFVDEPLAADALVDMLKHEKNEAIVMLLQAMQATSSLSDVKIMFGTLQKMVKKKTNKKFFRNFHNNGGTKQDTNEEEARVHKREAVMLALKASKALHRLGWTLTLEQAKALYAKVDGKLPRSVNASGSSQELSEVTMDNLNARSRRSSSASPRQREPAAPAPLAIDDSAEDSNSNNDDDRNAVAGGAEPTETSCNGCTVQ